MFSDPRSTAAAPSPQFISSRLPGEAERASDPIIRPYLMRLALMASRHAFKAAKLALGEAVKSARSISSFVLRTSLMIPKEECSKWG